jgi:hypothetical protein
MRIPQFSLAKMLSKLQQDMTPIPKCLPTYFNNILYVITHLVFAYLVSFTTKQ